MKQLMVVQTLVALAAMAGCQAQTQPETPGGDEPAPPPREPPAHTSTSVAHARVVLLATFQDEHFITWSYDLEAAQMSKVASGFLASHASPSGQRLVGVLEDGLRWAVTGRDGTDVHTFPEGYFGATLVDDSHVLICREGQQGSSTDDILAVDLESGREELLTQAAGEIWDDVHLRLTPDGRRVTFTRLNNRPGVYVLDLDSKEVTLLVSNAAGAWWSPDGTRFLTVMRGEGRRLAMFGTGEGQVERRDLHNGSAIGHWLDDRRLLINRASTRGIGNVVLRDLEGGEDVLVAEDVHFGEGSVFGWIVAVTEGSFVFLGVEDGQGLDLRRFDLDGGPDSVEVLATGLGEGGLILGAFAE